jgi:hypothetical protein
MANCPHTNQINPEVKPKTPQGCEECLKTGQRWVALRECQTCGHVGCCDSSQGRHARQHYDETHHAIMQAYPDQSWSWCYVDQTYL